MRFDIITANPKILEDIIHSGLIARAVKSGYLEIELHHLRDYADGSYKQIDDSPFGGGVGMVLKPEPFFRCVQDLKKKRDYDAVVNFSPQGKKLDQKAANNFSLKKNFILLCGHYKGIDERVLEYLATDEISIGDYVLSCGDIAALVFTDSVSRLIPGVLGDGESALSDTFQIDGFDHPQYTRPADFEGKKVPDVLLSGDHKKIEEWRLETAQKKYNKFNK
ncbi:tRNA (guanosine(37)-N1)-methyltransferase TrmD [soil metagenome]